MLEEAAEVRPEAVLPLVLDVKIEAVESVAQDDLLEAQRGVSSPRIRCCADSAANSSSAVGTVRTLRKNLDLGSKSSIRPPVFSIRVPSFSIRVLCQFGCAGHLATVFSLRGLGHSTVFI